MFIAEYLNGFHGGERKYDRPGVKNSIAYCVWRNTRAYAKEKRESEKRRVAWRGGGGGGRDKRERGIKRKRKDERKKVGSHV